MDIGIIILLVVVFIIIVFAAASGDKQPPPKPKRPHYTDSHQTGSVYFLTNPCFKEHWVKIGVTTRNVKNRVREFNTAVPENFHIVLDISCENPYAVEQDIHKALDGYRPNKKKEYFLITVGELSEELDKIPYLTKQEDDKDI